MIKLDKEVLARVLSDFATLIKAAADSTERGRFSVIGTLARQAQDFQQLDAMRVGDFDADNVGMYDLQGGVVLNGAPRHGFGDQAEIMRTIIDSLKDVAAARRSPAAELNELLTTRKLLLEQSTESTDDIDARIKTLRKEISNVVVPSLVLRGHQVGENEVRDASVVGTPDPDGEEVDGSTARPLSEEGLGEGHGAQHDEGRSDSLR